MSSYKCLNPECPDFEIVDDYYKFRKDSFRLIDGELVSKNASCPKCGQRRKEINPNEDIPLSEKSIEIAKYSSSSPDGKKAILKKRSHDHFVKEIKPFKDHQLHTAVENMKKASKG